MKTVALFGATGGLGKQLLPLLQTKYKDTNISFMIDDRNSNALFQLLFSYDYFDVTHKCLCKYISEKKKKTDDELAKETYFDELKNIILL
jgi:1-deoxy-D-xylulose 5-phosphate reductoisomerase